VLEHYRSNSKRAETRVLVLDGEATRTKRLRADLHVEVEDRNRGFAGLDRRGKPNRDSWRNRWGGVRNDRARRYAVPASWALDGAGILPLCFDNVSRAFR
jgi:hypothetical protein